MTRSTFTIAAIAVACIAADSPVTFESPCKCHGAHGKVRSSVKNDASLPPADANAIQAVTPSDIFSRPGPAVPLTQRSKRTGIERNWFALTGRVLKVKVEADGDLHIALQDATGNKPESSLLKCQQNGNGVQFVKRFLVGRKRDFLFTPALPRS
jgi:hypothetical protein